MEAISGATAAMARPAAAAAHREGTPAARRPEDENPAPRERSIQDGYAPAEDQGPTGRYRLGKDGDGNPKICFDGQPQGADAPEQPDRKAEEPAGEDAKKRTEPCTCDTGRVDDEIKALKEKQKELQRQLKTETDEEAIKVLEQKLMQVERELSQKDNDAYRRQHAAYA